MIRYQVGWNRGNSTSRPYVTDIEAWGFLYAFICLLPYYIWRCTHELSGYDINFTALLE